MSDQQNLIDCSPPVLADGIVATAEEMAKIRVNSISNAIGLATGRAPKSRIDDRETSQGHNRYHQLVVTVDELLLLDQSTLGGLVVEVTIGAFAGAYTPKESSDDGLAKLKSILG